MTNTRICYKRWKRRVDQILSETFGVVDATDFDYLTLYDEGFGSRAAAKLIARRERSKIG